MRLFGLIAAGALGLVMSAIAAQAAPAVPAPAAPQASNIVAVAGGCGWRAHRNWRGHCVANRLVYAPRPYWPGYYGGGHEPWNRPSPRDHVANRLNRQELGRSGWGY